MGHISHHQEQELQPAMLELLVWVPSPPPWLPPLLRVPGPLIAAAAASANKGGLVSSSLCVESRFYHFQALPPYTYLPPFLMIHITLASVHFLYMSDILHSLHFVQPRPASLQTKTSLFWNTGAEALSKYPKIYNI